MIKLIGMDGWIGSVGLTKKGKREVVRIPRCTLDRLVALKEGEIGIVSVAALRRIGIDAGLYYSLGGDIDMWLSPMDDEKDGSVSARLKDMYMRQGVRVNMRALFQLADIAGMIGVDKVRIVAKGGYWTLVENATHRSIVKEKDVALEVACYTQGMGCRYFEARDVERVVDNVRRSNIPPFYRQWDINGNGDVRMWLGEDGVQLGDDRDNPARIAYSYESGTPVSLNDATSADEWMERYTVWEEAMKMIQNSDKGTRELSFGNDEPIDEFVKRERMELGVDWPEA